MHASPSPSPAAHDDKQDIRQLLDRRDISVRCEGNQCSDYKRDRMASGRRQIYNEAWSVEQLFSLFAAVGREAIKTESIRLRRNSARLDSA
jgi:hypothetical protein